MDYKFYLDSLLKYLAEGILIVDKDANVVFYNEPVTDLAGISMDEAFGKNILDLFTDLTPETSTFYRVLKSQKAMIDHIQTYTNRKGRTVNILTSTIPLIRDGELVGALEVYRDLTQVKELSERIFELQGSIYNKTGQGKPAKGNGTRYTFDDIIAESEVMKSTIARARKIAASGSPLLVYGETGTGKEIFIQAIHNADPVRRKNIFIAQNCAALPKGLLESILFGTTEGSFTGARERQGLFELADGGTLLLDEINSMDIELQGKLLRILEDGVVRRIGGTRTTTVDVRTIASTNEDPARAVDQGKLREDLYYRLNVVTLVLPPLREHPEDIPPLVNHFIAKYNRRMRKNVKGVSGEVMNLFMKYPWYGNVRELMYTIESIMNEIEVDEIQLNHLPPSILAAEAKADPDKHSTRGTENLPSMRQALHELECDLIKRAIRAANGNRARAARLLDIPKQTLHNKIKKYKITWDTVTGKEVPN